MERRILNAAQLRGQIAGGVGRGRPSLKKRPVRNPDDALGRQTFGTHGRRFAATRRSRGIWRAGAAAGENGGEVRAPHPHHC